MNKSQLVEKVATLTQTTKSHSEELIDATLEVIQKAVAKGEDVKIVGFGTFSRTKRKARPGRNPKTGEPVTIPSIKIPRFKPGKEFKDRMN